MTGWWREERGGVATELVLITPLLLLFLLLVVALGRLTGARLDVDGAAGQAARAASLARDPATAVAAAERTAAAALADGHLACAQLHVQTDLGAFHPGGDVAVTVTCAVDLADLTGLRLPATRTVSARAVAVIDRFRSTA